MSSKILYKNSYNIFILSHNSSLFNLGSSFETIAANLACSNNIFKTETKNDVLNEIILSIFENNFNLFFESITSPDLSKQLQQRYFPKYYNYIKELGKENPTLIMVDTSLEVFQDCLSTLEKIYNNSQEEEEQREIINNELNKKIINLINEF